MSVRASTPRARVGGSAPAVRDGHLRLAAAIAVAVVAVVAVGFVFSGSPGTIAPGTKIADVGVGGLSADAARTKLEQRSASLSHVPVTFVAGTHEFKIRPEELSVSPDWAKAVEQAQGAGGGMTVIRGFNRLEHRLFPTNVSPKVNSYRAAVNYEIGVIAGKVDRPYKPARLVRNGLNIEIIPGQPGEVLDRSAAAKIVVAALADLDRSGSVELPTAVQQPAITGPDLNGARAVAEQAISAPVKVTAGKRTFQLEPAQIARMLQLPTVKGGTPILGGAAATAYFAKLDRLVGRPARSAHFAAYGSRVVVVPAVTGLSLDVPRSAAAVLAAAESSTSRVAHLTIATSIPGRTTAQANAMGITGLVSSYETIYGGIANRIHNVELVAHLVDNKLIPPGATFSFNKTTGARTAAKGFVAAPVIINGELETGLGGGVCQVSTTVFNAAYEAGLPITDRTNHALYISHYPLGRDATVDYPDIDLKFVNDTSHWLLLRTFVGSSSLVVSLYGTPQHRRVVTNAAPLKLVGPPPVQKTLDPSLAPGTSEVQDPGESAYSTSVERLVYAPGGKLMSDNTWSSNYRSSPEILLVGPTPVKVKPKPKTKPTTTDTTTTTTSTPPAQASRNQQ
ncbi:MAG TPA: VanW family protein [Gaiellaceae bacterium]|nr:VanW family protein [Gaiellaceae bacterium]